MKLLPRAFFDQLDPSSYREFVVLERTEVSYTDFRSTRIGKWNQADPEFQPQYAALFCLLSDERILQERSYGSVFQLIESLGASIALFYFGVSALALSYNRVNFGRQIKRLSLMDLKRDQFTRLGRLRDLSFQMPKECQDMSA